MKKQLFIAVALMYAGQAYAIISPADAQQKLNALVNLIKTSPLSSIRRNQPLAIEWVRTIENSTDYVLENSSNYLGMKDQDLVVAANKAMSFNTTIMSLYSSLAQDKNNIQKDSALKKTYNNAIVSYKQEIHKINYNIAKKTHSTTRRQNAQAVMNMTLLTLIGILNIMQTHTK